MVDRLTLRQSRVVDLMYIENPEYFEYLNIYFANCAPFHHYLSIFFYSFRMTGKIQPKESPFPNPTQYCQYFLRCFSLHFNIALFCSESDIFSLQVYLNYAKSFPSANAS
jgi:hypothetical protein